VDGEGLEGGSVNLAVLKKVINFLRKKVHPAEKILATPMLSIQGAHKTDNT